MPWTDITHAKHDRKSDRYPTDLTDAEWAVVSPLVPPSRAGGRPGVCQSSCHLGGFRREVQHRLRM